MIFFVGLTYAELTSAMPQCGGEHVFSHRAMGPIGSFIESAVKPRPLGLGI